MSNINAIDLLNEKVLEYENIIQDLLSKPRKQGTIVLGPEDKFYRVTDEKNETYFLPTFDKTKFKKGDNIWFTEQGIVGHFPSSLVVKKDPPRFKFIEWEEIGGIKSQLKEIRDAVELPLLHAHVYKQYNIEPIKGILLYGPPGCGKTLIAKAIASTTLKKIKEVQENSFIYIKGAELLSRFVGVAEEKIRSIFANSRKHYETTGHRSVVFIDEAEAILPIRGSRFSSDIDKTIVPTFLAEMDGFDQNGPLVILATNREKDIDEAILRDGRIDTKVEIKRPTINDAIEIFSIHLQKTKTADDIEQISNQASTLIFTNDIQHSISGAMIETIVKKSAQCSIQRSIKTKNKGKTGITMDDVEHTILNLKNNIYAKATN